MWGAIISAASGALGGILGSASKQQKVKEQQESVNQRRQSNDAWYNRRYNESDTQRADAQRMLTATEEALTRRNRSAEGRAAMMGGTDESVEAVREQGNTLMANTVSQIAANAANRKDAIEQQYLERKDKLDKEYQDLEAEKPNSLDYVSGALGGAGGGLSNIFGGSK